MSCVLSDVWADFHRIISAVCDATPSPFRDCVRFESARAIASAFWIRRLSIFSDLLGYIYYRDSDDFMTVSAYTNTTTDSFEQ